ACDGLPRSLHPFPTRRSSDLGEVEHDRSREHSPAVLIRAVNLDLVRTLGFEASGLESKHDDAAKRCRILVADERVEACAEDVDKAVGWRLRAVGEQRPVEPHDLTTSPPLTTSLMFSGLASRARSATGSPGTPMTSPHEPG